MKYVSLCKTLSIIKISRIGTRGRMFSTAVAMKLWAAAIVVNRIANAAKPILA